MEAKQILYPLFALVALTFYVGIQMVRSRFAAVKAGQVSAQFFKLHQGQQPEHLLKLSKNFDNLLATPMLFYVVCTLTYVTGSTNLLAVALAWAYVVSRCAHTWIHIGSNRLFYRMHSFLVSVLILLALWLHLLWVL